MRSNALEGGKTKNKGKPYPQSTLTLNEGIVWGDVDKKNKANQFKRTDLVAYMHALKASLCLSAAIIIHDNLFN